MAPGARRNPLRLSIIICCHNGGARLAPTLSHLAAQTGLAASRWEVLLVDNASTDDTVERARSLWCALGVAAELRIVSEPRLGVSYVRTTGIKAARYEIACFVDDDNWVCPEWGRTILDLMESHPDIGVLATTCEAAFDPGQIVPDWFPALQHGYAVGPQESRSGWVERALPRYRTAGLAFRRDAACRLFERGFSTLLAGRSGNSLVAGEDAEFCYGMGMTGSRFWYEGSLSFRHYMPSNRLSVAYARRLYHGHGVVSAVEDLYLGLAPDRTGSDLRDRMRSIGILRFANALRQFGTSRLRALRSPRGSASRARALIEASFFAGRMEGLYRYGAKGRDLVARIADWAPAGVQKPR